MRLLASSDTSSLAKEPWLTFLPTLTATPVAINIDGLLFPKAQPLAYHWARFVLVTVVLAAFVCLAAIVIPDVWTLFQLFGSTTSVCLSLIFPAAIVLRDVHEISGGKDKILATGMIILAVATSCIAIASNVISLAS